MSERIITPIYCSNGLLNGFVEVKPEELKERQQDKGFDKILAEKQEALNERKGQVLG